MTISYSGGFFRLLARWEGSIWRSTYRELIAYIIFYYLIKIFYLYGIDAIYEDSSKAKWLRNYFQACCLQFGSYAKQLPLTFLLGFYVSSVVARWWGQFKCLEWPENLLSALCMMIPGNDEKSQKRRHKIARYLNLTSALAWRELSIQLRAKYPSVHHLVDGGLMTENEFEALEEVQAVCPSVRWMTPLHWVQMILQEHIAEDQTGSSNYMKAIMGELMSFRQSFRALFCYDWVCVPLVYTQLRAVATVATYSFFIFSLFGRQFTSAGDHLIFPIFLIVEFLFFVGWLKVGRELMRPFGHGDDDIELHWILDRNIAVSFAIVNNLQGAGLPKGEETDIFWEKRGKKIEIPATGNNDNIKPRSPKLHTYLRIPHGGHKGRDTMSDDNDSHRHLNW